MTSSGEIFKLKEFCLEFNLALKSRKKLVLRTKLQWHSLDDHVLNC